jgi:hypothetical protein
MRTRSAGRTRSSRQAKEEVYQPNLAWISSAKIRAMKQGALAIAVVLYVLAMVAVIVGVDFVFFRNRFWERLTVNIGIVLVFASFYLRFLKRP